MIRYVVMLSFVAMLVGCGADESTTWIDQEYVRNVARFEQNDDVMVRRGLLADRKHRYVDLLATASDVAPGAMIDVVIASKDSMTTQYLVRAVVGSGELLSALEFIGLSSGHPIDVEQMHYWAKGERVTITFQTNESIPAESLLFDTTWNAELPQQGFRFVGPGQGAEGIDEGVHVATAYNASNTIFEVPYVVDRKTVLERLTVNSNYGFEPGQPVRVRIRPEFRGDRQRVHDYLLDVRPGEGDDAERLANLLVAMQGAGDSERIEGGFENVFVYLEEQVEDGIEPFIQVRFADALSAQSVKNIARFIQQFLIEQQIRIEPHASELYFSAFLPDDAWRDPNRRNRSSQPLEIHLQDKNGGEDLHGEIIQHVQGGDVKRIDFKSTIALNDVIQRDGPWQTDAVFIFVTPGTPYGQIKKIYTSIREEFPNVYVFP